MGQNANPIKYRFLGIATLTPRPIFVADNYTNVLYHKK